MASSHRIAGFRDEQELIAAVTETQASLGAAGIQVSPEARSRLIDALRGSVSDGDYACLDGAAGWDLDVEL